MLRVTTTAFSYSVMTFVRLLTHTSPALIVATLAAGCAERSFEYTVIEEELNPDAGFDAQISGMDTRPAVDRMLPAERAMRLDACVPTGQPERCNDLDDDCNGLTDDVAPEILTRTESCGSCGVVCIDVANATPRCTNSACAYTCVPGAIDIDNSRVNGCECILVGAAHDSAGTIPETLCDGRDNDCDGMTDEGFDKQNDPLHCGACNRLCSIPFAISRCEKGICEFVRCRDGFQDRDPNQAGCETACLPTNGGVEICDGADNDCDGMTDEAAEIAAGRITCRQGGVCGTLQAVCMGSQGWVCAYPPTFQEVEDQGMGCDGRDNDCDGLTDEAFLIQPPTPCRTPDTVLGECAREGFLRCNQAGTAAECGAAPAQPQPEICDGRDNDCDGLTDELTAANRTTDEAFVFLPNVGGAMGVTIAVYEATRVDATMSHAGFESGRRPCSVPNRLPWSDIRKEDAQAACARMGSGWRLCTGTEWLAACRSGAMRTYPYGNVFDEQICNGANYRPARTPARLPTGTAQNPAGTQCRSQDNIWDLSGNVREWTTTSPGGTTFELRGGAYNTPTLGGAAPGLRCDSVVSAPDTDVILPSVGFRCCRTGALP